MADADDAGLTDEQTAHTVEPEAPGTLSNDDALPVDTPPDAGWGSDDQEQQGEQKEQLEEQQNGLPEPELMDKQEAEEMAQMTQTVAAVMEAHLQSEEQSDDDVDDNVTSVAHANEVGDDTAPSAFLPSAKVSCQGTLLSDGRHPNGNGHRFPCLTPSKAHIPRLPSSRGARGRHYVTTSKLQLMTRALNPNKTSFPSKIAMSARAKVSASHPSNYVLNPRRPRKVVTWDAAMSARPPLRIDMEGPTPCTYTPATKPPLETNAPKWSFGPKTFVEKDGGSRTSWEKTWFQSSDVWTQKADFHSDKQWPPPSQYESPPAMGSQHPVAKAGHAHSIGIRRTFIINKKGSEVEPSPTDYNREASDAVTRKRAPSYTHSVRRGGTILWSIGDSLDNPGPGAYNPRSTYVNAHRPAFTIQGIRREKSHVLGPYAAF